MKSIHLSATTLILVAGAGLHFFNHPTGEKYICAKPEVVSSSLDPVGTNDVRLIINQADSTETQKTYQTLLRLSSSSCAKGHIQEVQSAPILRTAVSVVPEPGVFVRANSGRSLDPTPTMQPVRPILASAYVFVHSSHEVHRAQCVDLPVSRTCHHVSGSSSYYPRVSICFRIRLCLRETLPSFQLTSASSRS